MKMVKRPQFNYVFLTVTRSIDASLIGEYINSKTTKAESISGRINVLLADFAEEMNLGFLPSSDGETFVFFETSYISEEMAADYIGEKFVTGVAA